MREFTFACCVGLALLSGCSSRPSAYYSRPASSWPEWDFGTSYQEPGGAVDVYYWSGRHETIYPSVP